MRGRVDVLINRNQAKKNPARGRAKGITGWCLAPNSQLITGYQLRLAKIFVDNYSHF
jgi:hypothetical protein